MNSQDSEMVRADPVPPVRSTRTRQLDVLPRPRGGFSFTARLRDESVGGDFDPPDAQQIIHDFVVRGNVTDDLVLSDLRAQAGAAPFAQCPLILPAVETLNGESLHEGWRSKVLSRFGGHRGCTHVTSLLLSLVELTTLIYFQRINRLARYGPATRRDGTWTAIGMQVAPGLKGACHALGSGGQVVTRAEGHDGPDAARDSAHEGSPD